MKFSYGRNDLQDHNRAQSYSYLLTNGLGGYASATIAQSLTRNDHAMLMAAIQAPSIRYHMVSKVEEEIKIDGVSYTLTSQDYVDYSKNETGESYLINVTQEYLPTWHYFVDGVEITKTMVMEHGSNCVGLLYEIEPHGTRDIKLSITPCIQFVEKGAFLERDQVFQIKEDQYYSNGLTLYVQTSKSETNIFPLSYVNDVYYEYDARDGRIAYGAYVKGISYHYDVSNQKKVDILFAMDKKKRNIDKMIQEEMKRQKTIIKQSNAKSDLTKSFVRASDQFISKQDPMQSYTIIAGYPFFTDWGRDTMYAIEGCCIATNRKEDAKSILRTFVKYLKNGLLPNTFPEGDKQPFYNTVDASLLFFQALKELYDLTQDTSFIEEMYPYMVDIIHHYKKGTDYDIKMDEDGLIQAGSGYNQLTWMDIRYENILPTPRHGKPVEVNAFWYNALCTTIEFGRILKKEIQEYETLAKLTKQSFQEKFWNEERKCLKDVVSNHSYDNQVRCNQIWAVSTPYCALEEEQALCVVECVNQYLYTPYGLRTLEVLDKEFVASYGGSLKDRDLSYHQGTTWPFPLGSYYRAYLKVHKYSEQAKTIVKRQLSYMEDCLREGCIGQVAEIYDGLDPAQSRGCFAQAWSVGEILKVMLELEM